MSKGIFNVILGSMSPLNLSFDKPYYLGITVGAGGELIPRIQLTGSSYSMRSIRTDSINGITAVGDLTGTYPNPTISNNAVTSAKILDGTIQRVDVASTFKAPAADTADYARAATLSGSAGGDLTGTYPNPIIAAGAVTSAKILDGTITGADISSTAALNIASLTTTGNVGIGTTSPNEQLEITGNFRLPVSTASVGVIKSDTSRFIHNYGSNNFFAGVNAGNLTMTGLGGNTGVGVNALFSNTTGSENTANGAYALYSNTTGPYNTVNGNHALFSNTTGAYNTALGSFTGYNITTGSNNIAIGYNAQVPTGTADNQIRLGNTSITYAGIQVAWTVTSDRRYKENIQPLNLGLGFISKLNPVSYYRKADEKQRTEYGLIAQEVEQVLKECGVENPGMLTITDEGMYELRYNDLLAPMIKAIQELNNNNKELTAKSEELIAENKELKTKNQELAERLSTLETMVKSLVEKQSTETKSLGEVRMTNDQ